MRLQKATSVAHESRGRTEARAIQMTRLGAEGLVTRLLSLSSLHLSEFFLIHLDDAHFCITRADGQPDT